MRLAMQAVALATALALSPAAVAQSTPQWLTELPRADQHNYRATATAATLPQARQAALAAITAQVASRVSSESLTQQHKQHTSQTGTQTASSFELTIAGQSVPLQLNDVQASQQYRHANGDVSVLVEVSKQQIIDFLQNQLQQQQTLKFPQQADAAEQLLWLLRYKQPLQMANAYALAYQQLSGNHLTTDFAQQLATLKQAEQQLGLRIVASRDLDALSGQIAKHSPASTTPTLWLQLTQQQQQRQQGGRYQQRRQLLAAVTEPQSPFKTFHQKTIEVIGQGASAAEAAEHAQQLLEQQVSRPLSEWLFD